MSKARRKHSLPRRATRHKHLRVADLEADLLLRVRARPDWSRVDLAGEFKLAPSTVGAYVDRLIEEGFLIERKKPERDQGRPPTLLALNPDGGFFIGVDFDARKLLATIVDFSSQPVQQIQRNILATDSAEQVIAKIIESIEELAAGRLKQVLGIGIGVPGTLDPARRMAVKYAHIRGWENIPLHQLVTGRFKVDVFLENNIRSMALAELWFGQGRGLDNFVCLGIRTGVAAGIIVRNELVQGTNNLAGEIRSWLCPAGPIGHREDGPPPDGFWHSAGLRPLEQIASLPAILKAVREAIDRGEATSLPLRAGLPTFEEIVQAMAVGDPCVTRVLGNVAQTLGWVCCQLNTLFNPPKIILAGPLADLGASFIGPLQESAARFCAESALTTPSVVDSELGVFNGALGAAALALHEWKPRR